MGTPLQEAAEAQTPASESREVTRLRDLSPQQVKSGLAAWLGWLFDGLDMHLYVLVATPFVAELIAAQDRKDPRIDFYSSWIQAAFMFGWAIGGAFFGRIADRMGRSRALMLTILTYALFTGLSYFAQTWWQLLIFRFMAALGIGGEWAVGASLLSETWPKRWRPWIAAVLQTGVNIGVLLAVIAYYVLLSVTDNPNRLVFLVGVLPAFMVLWIRWAVPEPEEWRVAKLETLGLQPRFLDLFRGPIRRTTLLTLLVCALSLSGHWAFLYWNLQYIRGLEEFKQWTEADVGKQVGFVFFVVIVASVAGNFLAAAIARYLRYRRAIALLCLAYALSLFATYALPLSHNEILIGLVAIGLCQGLFGLFTMYMPPLFPTLLRTTGAGFCYNFGRIVAGFGIVFFGMVANVENKRLALFSAGFLFLPAALIAMLLPEPPDE